MQNDNMNATRIRIAELMRICVAYVCAAEIIMFLINYVRGSITGSTAEYVVLYVGFPIVWNVIMCCLLIIVNNAKKLSDRQKTRLMVFIISKICACVAIVHSYYIATQCVFAITIIVAALIAGRKEIIFAIADSILMLIVVIMVNPIFCPARDRGMMIESAFIALVVLIAVGTITLAISQYIRRNNSLMLEYTKQLEKAVYESKLDVMTGLYHHAEFYNIMHYLLSDGTNKLSVAIMDIDNFKSINDVYGHESGDKAITAIADDIRGRNNDNDIFVSRYGGEEFAFIFVNIDREKVIGELQSVRREISNLRFDFDKDKSITVSVGLFECCAGSYSAEDIFNNADAALYYAKEHGRDQLRVYGAADEVPEKR